MNLLIQENFSDTGLNKLFLWKISMIVCNLCCDYTYDMAIICIVLFFFLKNLSISSSISLNIDAADQITMLCKQKQ